MTIKNLLWSHLALISATCWSVSAANFESPDSVENTILQQKTSQKAWREQLADQGVTFGADYISQGFASSNGADGSSVNAASGVARFYGQWNIVGQASGNTGGLVWKIEHRHAYNDKPIKSFAFLSGNDGLGYVGMLNPAFSDQGMRITNLHWKQKLNGGRSSLIIGFQDVTDYVDAYALASPWTGFSNLAFQTGAGAMGLPDDGLLAISAGHMLTDNYYVVAGIADANGRSDIEDTFKGFDSFVNDNDYFTTLEFGWAASQQQIYTENVHLTYWYLDPTENDDGTPRHSAKTSSGLNFSASYFASDQVMPFVRGGVSFEGDAALYDTSISAGFGYFGLGAEQNSLGAAINWSKVNDEAFGIDDSQVTVEVYYNMQFGEHLQITPDIQWINNPALSDESNALVFGLRARVLL